MSRVLFSAAAAALLMTAMTTDANAGDRNRHRRHHSQPVYSNNGNLPSFVPGVGTYVGGISALRDRGNGLYFYVEPGVNRGHVDERERRGPSVIHVRPDGNKACAWEAGVCVIRN